MCPVQVYGPCILIVVISWVPFWLNREATSDRITLGITTVLTMTFLGLEARKNLPEVPYATALDVFLFISYMYIILTVIQFGAVHHYTKLGSGEFYPEELEAEISFSKRGHKQVEEIFANLRQRRASDALCFMLRKVIREQPVSITVVTRSIGPYQLSTRKGNISC